MILRLFALCFGLGLTQLIPTGHLHAQDANIQLTPRARRCATEIPSAFRIEVNEILAGRFRAANAMLDERQVPLTIVVQFIHIVDGNNGKVTADQRKKQIQVLNDAYQTTNVKFDYDENSTIVKDNATWFQMGHGTPAERAAKEALHKDPKKFLNFYTCAPPGGLLGWATFPWDLGSKPELDGVVLAFDTLPDGAASRFNEGDTGTHEVGHWCGLYHTFQDACTMENDRIADTLSHAIQFGTPNHVQTNNAVCQDQRLTAPFDDSEKAQLDNIAKNFMNYVDDNWMDRFTPDQVTRIKQMIMVYRSELFLTGPNPAASSNQLPFNKIQMLP